MKCQACGTDLIPGNNTCPNCGNINGVIESQVLQSNDDDDMMLLDDDDVVITENMAPPTLDVVSEENVMSQAGDIANANVSTYEDEQEVNKKEQRETNPMQDAVERVDIEIPAAKGPVEKVDLPLDGSAPEVVEMTETIGENLNENVPVEETSKKSKLSLKSVKSVPKNIMIIFGIFVFVIGLLVGKMVFSKNYCAVPKMSKTENVKYVSDGKNNETNIGGHTYKIPKDYTYDKKDKGVIIYSKDNSWRIYIRVREGSYKDLTGSKNSIKASLKENNIDVANIKEMKIEDTSYLTIEGTLNTKNRLMAFTDAGNDSVYYTEIVTNSNDYDYDVLAVAADIIKNAVAEKPETDIEKINVNDISELSVKASQEYKSLMANNN